MNQGVQFKAARLNDGNQSTGRRQAIDGQNAQRRRAIEKHDGVFGQLGFLKTRSQEELPARLVKQFRFGPAKLDGAWRQGQIVGYRLHLQPCPIGEGVVKAVGLVAESECPCQTGLRVHIDDVNWRSTAAEQTRPSAATVVVLAVPPF